jgi:HEPN domain-containing protein
VVDGRPDPAQLHTVLAPIIERVDPDLIVVFGSAARGSMTPRSDVDLLVVKNVENLSALRVATLGALSSGHPPVDVVPATLSLLERYSESLSWVYRPAVVEGLVAYERDRVVRFGSRHARDLLVRAPETEAARMVRLLKYQKEEASAWLDKAREDLTAVNSTDQGLAVPVRCYCAQAAAEKALEALLVAHGRLVPRDHGLLELAEAVRQTGERLPAAVTDDTLAQLTAYSGPAQYPGWSGETTAVDLRDFSQLANAIHDHVDRRIADILQERASSA